VLRVATEKKRASVVEEVRRRQIMESTVAVVAEVGFAGASLAAIAQRAGLSKGLLSYHFRDKDDLMEQTALWVFADFEESVVAGLDISTPAPDLLRQIVRQVAAHGVAHRVQRRALDQIIRNLRGPDGSPRFSLADYESTYAAQEQLFRRGQREGAFRAFDTRVMAVTLQAAMDTMFGYADAHPDVDVERYADQLADLLLAAVAV
jgi:AcrR family transcriptional regulator